jgi:hypothetical protein
VAGVEEAEAYVPPTAAPPASPLDTRSASLPQVRPPSPATTTDDGRLMGRDSDNGEWRGSHLGKGEASNTATCTALIPFQLPPAAGSRPTEELLDSLERFAQLIIKDKETGREYMLAEPHDSSADDASCQTLVDLATNDRRTFLYNTMTDDAQTSRAQDGAPITSAPIATVDERPSDPRATAASTLSRLMPTKGWCAPSTMLHQLYGGACSRCSASSCTAPHNRFSIRSRGDQAMVHALHHAFVLITILRMLMTAWMPYPCPSVRAGGLQLRVIAYMRSVTGRSGM